MGEKRYIPHTSPKWGLELPDDKYNSLVSRDGTVHDDGYNFDEKKDAGDDEEEQEESQGWDSLAEPPKTESEE